jgi:hypothetical protein
MTSKLEKFARKLMLMFLAIWIAMNVSFVGLMALAADDAPAGTLLPSIEDGIDCEQMFLLFTREELKTDLDNPGIDSGYKNNILGCAVKTGRVSLWMVPYFLKYIIEFILYLGGLVAVGGIVYGGIMYTFSGLSNDKEKGKKAVLYSVGGMVLMYLAWTIVNVVIGLLTG